jgi:membrane associated rhomboid family serine protease
MVFPLYDDNPFKFRVLPYVTWGLIALNVLVFLVQASSDAAGAKAILASFGATPAAVFHEVRQPGFLPAELTLVTSMFLHGGWEHLLGNMLYLWVFGDDIEEAMGPARFIVFYLLCGIAAALAYSALDIHSTIPLVGASGAISGILAAYLLLRPCAKVSVFVLRVVVRVRAYWVIGGWVLLQLYLLANRTNDDVAYIAHVGGLVAGAALFVVLRPAGVQLLECIEEPPEGAAAT